MVRRVKSDNDAQGSYHSKIDAETNARWDKCGPCGFMGCTDKGMIAIQTTTGWLNVCIPHYHEYWRGPDIQDKLEAAGKR